MGKLLGHVGLGLALVAAPATVHAQSETAPSKISRAAADPVSNGVGIGVAIGAGTGFGLMHWAYNSCKDNCDAPEPLPMYLGAISMGAAVGGVTGWLIDRAHKGRKLAVVPVIAKQRKGVALSLTY